MFIELHKCTFAHLCVFTHHDISQYTIYAISLSRHTFFSIRPLITRDIHQKDDVQQYFLSEKIIYVPSYPSVSLDEEKVFNSGKKSYIFFSFPPPSLSLIYSYINDAIIVNNIVFYFCQQANRTYSKAKLSIDLAIFNWIMGNEVSKKRPSIDIRQFSQRVRASKSPSLYGRQYSYSFLNRNQFSYF